MKKFKIITEEHVSEEFVLEPGNVSYKLMSGETVDRKESIEWIEF